MPRPTKFEILRANRELADWRNRDMTPYTEAVKAGVTAERILAAPLEPAVPTMEIDGERYRMEVAPVAGLCEGCANWTPGKTANCLPWNAKGAQVFGKTCHTLPTHIYVKAE